MKHTKHIKYGSYDYYWHISQGWKCQEVIDNIATLVKEVQS